MNRLSSEKSPYLLQHAANPVEWYPWGPEAFSKAAREDKPIFLSIGYSTCHWCHVMEHESFENAETAKILNESYVSVKVDREERPDLDTVYMSYVQAVTGSGGWPMSVFLTPEKKPFYGGTYFPPADRFGMPGFPTLLKSIAGSWKTARQEILDSADSAVDFLSKTSSAASSPVEMRADTLDSAAARFAGSFDPEHGGFGRAPKFPRSHALSFMLRYWLRKKDAEALALVEKTLEAMADGGMYDHLGGGFHRYSTDALWRIPHFEKMLYDQALTVQTYLDAFQATGKESYARIARETLDYVRSRMTSKDGAFFSAEDADSADPKDPSHKKEGAYFVWEKAEIEKALGADAAPFIFYYGIEEKGNAISDPHHEFENKNVLYRAKTVEETAKEFKKTPADIEALLERGRAALLRLRDSRPRPHLDDKVLADWNALMIGAFARAFLVLGDKGHLEAALSAARFIEGRLRDGSGRLLHRWRDGEAAIRATLNDHAFLVDAYLYLSEASSDPAWLARAKAHADEMLGSFLDASSGGFFLTAHDAEVLISRPKELYDGAIPSGNSTAALALRRLSLVTGQASYGQAADRVMAAFSEQVVMDPSNYPVMLIALDLTLDPSQYTCRGDDCSVPPKDKN